MKYIKVIAALCVVFGMYITGASAQSSLSRNQRQATEDVDLRKFTEFYTLLNALYVDSLDNSQLIEKAIVKVLAELDPHSSYSDAEEMKAMNESMGGSFSVIGVQFDVLLDTLMVVNTVPGGPAEKVGVLANDRIVKIDNEDVIGISRARVPHLLRGQRNSKVTIEVLRKGVDAPLKFVITRDNIPIYTVDAAYMVDENIGYIKVNRFASTTMGEFEEAFRKLGKMDALILDLRGNGGGLLDQAAIMSEFFLPKGSVVTYMEGMRVPTSIYTANHNGVFLNGNLVVLIDSSSASGSEIVAGAIQDWDRGIIVGRQSFGKGLVQRQLYFNDGSAVRITVARYHTPSGRVIQRPFEPGKKDDYYIDHIMRTYDQKYADSVSVDSPLFYTLKNNRPVAGGGGITPDITIPIDTTKNYAYLNRLSREGLLNEFVNTYIDNHRDRISKDYGTFELFENDFAVSESIIGDLIAFGESRGALYNEEIDRDSMPTIKNYIKAMIARKMWGPTEYYKIVNLNDDAEFDKAVEILRDQLKYDSILSGSSGSSVK